MSHSTHIFLTNEGGDLEDAVQHIDSMLSNNNLDRVDSYEIIGALDLNTDEYIENKFRIGHYNAKIQSKSDLEAFANILYSKDYYERCKAELDRLIKAELWFNAKCICEQLDGIQHIKANGFPKWEADSDKVFAIYDGYYDMDGISDWRSNCIDINDHTFAVIVDFHS